MANRFYYELAWAEKSAGNQHAAVKAFADIVTKFADSPEAAEANFHVAQYAYDQGDYELAMKGYQ
nr:tetratricopeptide repeat protein [Burkholderiales bacterium]